MQFFRCTDTKRKKKGHHHLLCLHLLPTLYLIPRPPSCTYPATPHPALKPPITRQEPRPRRPLERRNRTHLPLNLSHRRPFLGDPVAHRSVVPCGEEQPRSSRPRGMSVDVPNSPQHGRLVGRKPTIPEAPRMDPKLLPIEVTQLKHAMLGQERVCMVPRASVFYAQ